MKEGKDFLDFFFTFGTVVDANDTLYQKFFASRKLLQYTHVLGGGFVTGLLREEKKKNFSPSNNLIKKSTTTSQEKKK